MSASTNFAPRYLSSSFACPWLYQSRARRLFACCFLVNFTSSSPPIATLTALPRLKCNYLASTGSKRCSRDRQSHQKHHSSWASRSRSSPVFCRVQPHLCSYALRRGFVRMTRACRNLHQTHYCWACTLQSTCCLLYDISSSSVIVSVDASLYFSDKWLL